MTGEQRFEPEPPSAESVKTHQGFVKIFMSQTLSPGRAHQQPSEVWGSPVPTGYPLPFYFMQQNTGLAHKLWKGTKVKMSLLLRF